MRRMLMVCVAAAAALFSGMVWAGNQETAEQIASNLRKSGQLTDYRIAVKFQDGTAWVQGRVRDQDQMNRALKLVFQTPGVTRVVNDLAVGNDQTAEAPQSAQKASGTNKPNGPNPLRGANNKTAQALSSSFTTSPAQRVAMMQPVPPAPGKQPAPPAPVAATPEIAPPGAMPAGNGAPLPMYSAGAGGAPAPVRYDQPQLPNYAWPSYAAYPNYAALTYPKQYSPTAWPYIGPFYPYPQVPLGWRKVTLEWSDGWWQLDFKDQPKSCWWR
jgi:hypothetical protein